MIQLICKKEEGTEIGSVTEVKAKIASFPSIFLCYFPVLFYKKTQIQT